MLSVLKAWLELGEAEPFIQSPDERCVCGSGSYLGKMATEEPLWQSFKHLFWELPGLG